MATYNGVITIDVSWTILKGYVTTKNLALQYEQTTSAYEIFCLDGNIAYRTIIFRGSVPNTVDFNQTTNDSDKTDFETSYKDVTTNRVITPSATVDGYSITTANPTLIAGSDGSFIRTLKSDSSGRLIMVGLGTAGTPSGGVVSIQGVSGGQAIPITGSVTTTNSSTGSTGAAPPSQATYVAGLATTAAPTYTTGQLNALSLTTSGALRIDGSAVTQPVSGTVTANAGTGNFTVVQATAANLRSQTASEATTAAATGTVASLTGGAVTTAAPTYTTGQMNPLSLTTGGLLRVDGSGVTQPVSGTVTSNIGTTNGLALDATLTGNNQRTRITDGTNLAAVKAASTAAVAADPALVVAISPNNPITTTNADVTASGALNALNAAVTVTIPGKSSVGFQLSAGTLIGTIVAEISIDGGTTWNATYFDQTNGNKVLSVTFASSNTALASTIVGVGGAGQVRVRVSAFTSGTANITLRASNITDPSTLSGGAAGSTLPPVMNQFGGSVTTAAPTYTTGTLNAISLTTAGALRIDGSGVTQPVSGSGNFTVVGATAVGATPATNPVLFAGTDGGGVVRIVRTTSVGGITLAADQTVGSGVPGTAVQVGASDGTNIQALRVTTGTPTGTENALIVKNVPSGTQAVSGTVSVSGLTFPFPTVGNVAVGAATSGAPLLMGFSDGTNVRYGLSDTSGRQYIAQQDTSVTGNLTALNSTVTINPSGKYTVGGQILGTWVGTITAEGTVDGTNWFTVRTANKSTNDIVQTYTANDQFEFYSVAGCIGLRLRMSAYTSGTAAIVLAGTSLATDAFLNYSGPDNDAAPPLRHVSIASLSNDGTLHSPRNTNVDPTGTEYALVTRDLLYGDQQSSFSPDTHSISTATPGKVLVDSSNSLQIRGQVLTDEASFRDDFPGATLTPALTGTVSWVNNSTAVTGTGTLFTTEIQVGDYIKKTADANTLFVRVMSVESDTALTLETVYTGTTAAAASVRSYWIPTVGASGAIAVGTSNLTITTGTTNGVINNIIRRGDFGPITLRIAATVSQRIANQELRIGFSDNVASLTPNIAAYVSFTGTTNTTCNFVTSSSVAAADTQTTAVTLPSGNTSTVHEYKIDVSGSQATLSIDGVVVARNTLHIPGPYDDLDLMCLAANTGVAASSTTLTIDYCYFNNINRLQIDDDFNGEPITIQGGSSQGQPTIVNPVLVSGSDGTNTQIFRVKPASTAAVATDPSLVVSMSPNFPADPLSTGNIAALNNAVSLSLAGKTSAGAQISGTWVGTITFESSNDGGVTWFSGRAAERQGAQIIQTTTGNGNFAFADISGVTNIRLRASAWTSGTAAVTIAGTTTASDSMFNYTSIDGDTSPAIRFLGLGLIDAAGTFRFVRSANTTPAGTEYGVITRNIPSGTQTVAQATAANLRAQTAAESTTAAAVPTVAVMAGGSDGTNLRALKVATDGTQIVSSVDGTKTTYSAAATSFAPPATPTDIFTITGSASKTVRVTRVLVTGTQTTGAMRDILLIKRSTANSAGTSTTSTAVPHDSTNAAATAVVRAYTANPTLGTTVGTIFAKKIFISGTTVAQTEQVVDFGIRNGQSVVLRGTNEVLAVNLNSVTSTGNLISVTVEWTEE